VFVIFDIKNKFSVGKFKGREQVLMFLRFQSPTPVFGDVLSVQLYTVKKNASRLRTYG
jgi:hypothetical protein